MNSIRHLRIVLGCSQYELAAIAGTSQAMVSRWERDVAEPRSGELRRMREEVQRRGLIWPDEWWFYPPDVPPPRAAEAA